MLSAAPPVPGAALLQRCAGMPEPCGCHDEDGATALQPRLRIGPAGDRYEQEAERMSAAVMASSPASPAAGDRAAPGPEPATVPPDLLQRSLDPGEEQADPESSPPAGLEPHLGIEVDEDVDEEVDEEIDGDVDSGAGPALGRVADVDAGTAGAEAEGGPAELRLHVSADGPRVPGPQVQRYVDGLGRSGLAIPEGTRRRLEPLFGQDFSDVRVHDDPAAASAAQSVGALAFTVGRHVVFGAGQYAPGTRAGQALLAHELTHIVQQSGRPGGAPREIQRAPWGPCPPGPSLPGNRPFRYASAEFTMLSYFRAVGGSSCWSSNIDKFWEMSCTGQACRRVRQFIRNFRSGKGSQNRRITADPRNVAAPRATDPGADPVGALDAIIGSEPAVTAVAAFVQPDIIDFQHREIYDVTTARQAGRKVRKVQGYALLASRITGEHWTAGTRLQNNPMPPPYRFLPKERICFGPTDLAARPGVLAYEVIGTGKKDKKKKDKKKAKKEQKKKEQKKKEQKKKEQKKKEQPKTAAPAAANFTFGIGILSTGGGSANAGVGISVMSHGVSYGTVSAGVVYDSSGHAVGTVSAGVGAGNTGAAALSAGAGAAKNTTSAGALTAGAGTSSGSTSVGAVTAGAGSSKDDMTAGAVVAGKGTSEGNIAAGAVTAGSGRSEGNVAAVAGTRGHGDVTGQIGTTTGGGAGTTGTTGQGPVGGAQGAEAARGTEGPRPAGTPDPGTAGGTSPGADAGAGGAHGLGVPGLAPADVDRAVEQAAETERLLRQASPAQRAFFTALIQKMEGGPFVVTGPEWMRLMLTATKDVSQEDLAYLITLNWQPGQVTAQQLREQVRQALARRAAGQPPGLPAEEKAGEGPVAVPMKRPSQPVARKAEHKTPSSRTPPGGAQPEGKETRAEKRGEKTGSRGAAGTQTEAEETAEERAARIERLARRARDDHPAGERDRLLYSRSAKPGQGIDATVYMHGQVSGTGETTWWTADLHGRLVGDPARAFQVTAGSELVSADGQVVPAGWWTQDNPLTFAQ